MSVRVDIISIGTLARNLLWNESAARRTPHATCSLITAGKRRFIIDPGLPAPALSARLNERTGMGAGRISDVFLTHIHNQSIAGLELFEDARWWAHEAEIESLRSRIEAEQRAGAEHLHMRELLEHLEPAPDKLAPGLDLFPLPGYTRGCCGLLLAAPLATTLISGPAVASLDHFLAGQVLPDCADVEQAKQSLQEVYEIADSIVPGFDNLFANPRQFGG